MAAKELGISSKTLTQEPSTPVILASVDANGRSPEWVEKKESAWKYIGEKYHSYFTSDVSMQRVYAQVKIWDEWAKVNNPELYNNPQKPIFYMQAIVNMDAEQQVKVDTEAREAQAASAAYNARAAASSQAAVDAVKDRYARQQTDRQEQSEQDMKKFEDSNRERRLQQLEKADHDRRIIEQTR